MNEHLFVCGCEESGKISKETVNQLKDLLENKNIPYSYIEDLCGSIIKNPQDLLNIHNKEKSIIIGCHPRAMKWLLDYAIFCTCGTELEFHHADEVIENEGLKVNKPIKDVKANIEYTNDWKPWFPVIDFDKCTHCMKCMSFCLFGVYEKDDQNKLSVTAPANCKDECPACAKVCPEEAIIFPKHNLSPIDGGEGSIDNMIETGVLQNIENEGLYAALNSRRKSFNSVLIKENKLEEALKEREACACSQTETVTNNESCCDDSSDEVKDQNCCDNPKNCC